LKFVVFTIVTRVSPII